jgi:transposase
MVVRKRLRRGQVLTFFVGIAPYLFGLEACATAHRWARELIALCHEARLMPPNYVKAYVKGNKHTIDGMCAKAGIDAVAAGFA